MGFGGIGIWQLLIILVIIILLFGTKKLRNIGSDLGGAIKSFRSSMKEGGRGKDESGGEAGDTDKEKIQETPGNTVDDGVAGEEEKDGVDRKRQDATG